MNRVPLDRHWLDEADIRRLKRRLRNPPAPRGMTLAEMANDLGIQRTIEAVTRRNRRKPKLSDYVLAGSSAERRKEHSSG